MLFLSKCINLLGRGRETMQIKEDPPEKLMRGGLGSWFKFGSDKLVVNEMIDFIVPPVFPGIRNIRLFYWLYSPP